MAQTQTKMRAFRIRCHAFSPEEVDALRSLLKLLKDHLKHPWTVSESEPPDLVFANLDNHEVGDGFGSAVVVGCAMKPRLAPAGAIHRPFRAAAVLAVLTEAGAELASKPVDTADESVEWRYRLHFWPLEFAHWPRASLQVMAAITGQHASVKEIALRTGLEDRDIAQVLGLLRKMGILDRLVERRCTPRVDENLIAGWRGLASRVGKLLGFAR